MNLVIADNIIYPLNLIYNGEGANQPCGKHPTNMHKFEMWSMPQVTNDEKISILQSVVPLSAGEHTITYANTGVTHTVKPITAPIVSMNRNSLVKILVNFEEVNVSQRPPMINVIGKEIQSKPLENLLVKGEMNAERITFVLDRIVNGVDIAAADMNYQILGITPNGKTAYDALSKDNHADADKFTLTWTVSEKFTAESGALRLWLNATKSKNGKTTFNWETMPARIFVKEGVVSFENDEVKDMPISASSDEIIIRPAMRQLEELESELDRIAAKYGWLRWNIR